MMVTRHLSAAREIASGTLEGTLPTLLIDESNEFSSEMRESIVGSNTNMLGINQQVAWIEGSLHVSF